MDSNKLDGIDIVVRYIIRNPVNKSNNFNKSKLKKKMVNKIQRMVNQYSKYPVTLSKEDFVRYQEKLILNQRSN